MRRRNLYFERFPLHAAARMGRVDATRELLKARCSVNASHDEQTPLLAAASRGMVWHNSQLPGGV